MTLIDIACLIVVGAVTWFVASDGISGAVQTFLCTLLSGLMAMNFFEPVAFRLRAVVPEPYCEIVALLGLFTGLVFALRMGMEHLSPSYIQVIPTLDTVGRWIVGSGTGYLTMAFLLTALHTAPLPREFMGFRAERENFLGLAPDRQWLGFTQYVSEKPLAILMQKGSGAGAIVYSQAFDGRFEIIGDPQKPYSIRDSSGREVPQVVWPSFPIRYAMRRERMGGGQSGAATIAPVQTAPNPAPPPRTHGTEGGPNPGF